MTGDQEHEENAAETTGDDIDYRWLHGQMSEEDFDR
jgi:hypothetical protein|tara:strand:+ start:1420 stop:1527 length:108 start_codon:yes stop_codon:yes gene_type:complete